MQNFTSSVRIRCGIMRIMIARLYLRMMRRVCERLWHVVVLLEIYFIVFLNFLVVFEPCSYSIETKRDFYEHIAAINRANYIFVPANAAF